jgi:predicted alpha/beta-fold hydrolase
MLVDKAGVPIGLIMAKDDALVYPSDTIFLKNSLSHHLVYWKEINGGHLTF